MIKSRQLDEPMADDPAEETGRDYQSGLADRTPYMTHSGIRVEGVVKILAPGTTPPEDTQDLGATLPTWFYEYDKRISVWTPTMTTIDYGKTGESKAPIIPGVLAHEALPSSEPPEQHPELLLDDGTTLIAFKPFGEPRVYYEIEATDVARKIAAEWRVERAEEYDEEVDPLVAAVANGDVDLDSDDTADLAPVRTHDELTTPSETTDGRETSGETETSEDTPDTDDALTDDEGGPDGDETNDSEDDAQSTFSDF